MYNFNKAELEQTPFIYRLWKNTSQRIMGLERSIVDGDVYVVEDTSEGNKVVAFVRIAHTRTTDYLKINELYIDKPHRNVIDFMFWSIDCMIIKFGYIKAKSTIAIEMYDIFEQSEYVFSGIKTRISKDKSYNNLIMVRELPINIVRQDIDEFGVML